VINQAHIDNHLTLAIVDNVLRYLSPLAKILHTRHSSVPATERPVRSQSDVLTKHRKFFLAIQNLFTGTAMFACSAHSLQYAQHNPMLLLAGKSNMPILTAEPVCYPDNLFEEHLASTQGRWWVFYTRPRCEKAIARSLRAKKVAYFLPVYKKYVRVRRQTVTSWHVLFPNYIFVHGDRTARLEALKTNQIVHELSVPDQLQLTDDLANIFRIIQSGANPQPESHLQPGTPVEVIAGPLMGLRGKVITWASRVRLIVEVRLLQRAVAVELEPWMVATL
jgi:transcription antitermination factor NusG